MVLAFCIHDKIWERNKWKINSSKKANKQKKTFFFVIWGLTITDKLSFDFVPIGLKECGVESCLSYNTGETGKEGPRDNIILSKTHHSVTYFLHLGPSYHLPVTKSIMTSSCDQSTLKI